MFALSTYWSILNITAWDAHSIIYMIHNFASVKCILIKKKKKNSTYSNLLEPVNFQKPHEQTDSKELISKKYIREKEPGRIDSLEWIRLSISFSSRSAVKLYAQYKCDNTIAISYLLHSWCLENVACYWKKKEEEKNYCIFFWKEPICCPAT